jgi:hypothetical protein
MKRINTVIVAVVVVACGVIAYQLMAGNSGQQPVVNVSVAKTSSVFPPPLPTVTTVAQPKPQAPVIAPPLPAPIVKELAVARALAPKRPMTQLEKSWFGCATEDAYKTTMALIEQKNPGSADHFKGAGADCAPLPTGTHITVLRINDASGIAQISTNDTHQVYWTDTAVLGGDLKQN